MNSKEILSVILAIQLATIVSIIFNVFFARQILGFVYLAFVPGYLLFRLLKADKVGLLETAVFSVGLSLAFLMFAGLLLNAILPVLGYGSPLSTLNLTLLVICPTLILTAVALIKSEKQETLAQAPFKVTPIVGFFIALPFLTIIGSKLSGVFSFTPVMMSLTAIIPILVLFIFFKHSLPQKSYPLVLFSIAFFLLIGTSLITNYVMGADVQTETYFAKLTSINSLWDASIQQPYNGMLSVTILPTLMSKIMEWDITWIFKVAYPLMFALVPVTLYMAYRKQTNSIAAFLAVFFFISMDTFFLQMLGLARQMIAEIFFGLIILLLVENRLDVAKKRLLFFVFGAGIIVSHYSLGYILAFYVILVLLISRFFRNPADTAKSTVTPALAGGLIAVMLAWDLFVTPSAFQSLQSFITYVLEQVQSSAPAPGIGGLMPEYLSPLHDISKYLFLLVQGLIGIGFFGLLIRRKKSGFNREYAAMCVGSFTILLLTLLVPSFGTAGLNVTRFYHIALFFVAPFCVTGPIFVLSVAAKIKNKISPPKQRTGRTIGRSLKRGWLFAVTIVLISVFLFQVGFIYEIASDSTPSSLALSRNRTQTWTLYLNQLFIDPQEISASHWLSAHNNPEALVFGDFGTKFINSYGFIPYENYHLLDPNLETWQSSYNYFFFAAWNLQHGKVEGMYQEWSMDNFSFIHTDDHKIYSNGASDIYYGK